MQNTISIIYVGATSVSVVTSLPQLRQLWIMKDSSEFSLFSWVAWLIAQLTALAYALSIASLPYIIVNFLWVGFYVAMISLIIKYRHPARVVAETSQE